MDKTESLVQKTEQAHKERTEIIEICSRIMGGSTDKPWLMFLLMDFQLYKVQKWYTFSRNHTSNFEFWYFPGLSVIMRLMADTLQPVYIRSLFHFQWFSVQFSVNFMRFSMLFFNSGIIALRCCVSFRCTTKWISYIHTHTHTHTHIYPPSLLNLPPTPTHLGHHRAQNWAPYCH